MSFGNVVSKYENEIVVNFHKLIAGNQIVDIMEIPVLLSLPLDVIYSIPDKHHDSTNDAMTFYWKSGGNKKNENSNIHDHSYRFVASSVHLYVSVTTTTITIFHKDSTRSSPASYVKFDVSHSNKETLLIGVDSNREKFRLKSHKFPYEAGLRIEEVFRDFHRKIIK